MNQKSVPALFLAAVLLAAACSSSTEDPVADDDGQPDEFADAVAAGLPAGSPGAIVRIDVGGEMVAEAAAGEVAFDSARGSLSAAALSP